MDEKNKQKDLETIAYIGIISFAVLIGFFSIIGFILAGYNVPVISIIQILMPLFILMCCVWVISLLCTYVNKPYLTYVRSIFPLSHSKNNGEYFCDQCGNEMTKY